jgi:hypothetical protein
MFFTFPEDARWNADRKAVEIGEYRGVVTVPRRVFQRLLPEWPTPEKWVEAHYLQRTGIVTPPPPPSFGREHLFDPFQEQIG